MNIYTLMCLSLSRISKLPICTDETRKCDKCTIIHKDAVSRHIFEFISLGFEIFVKMSDLTLYPYFMLNLTLLEMSFRLDTITVKLTTFQVEYRKLVIY
jgi:hypothetical protein